MNSLEDDTRAIAAALAALAADIARSLLGDPSHIAGSERRWGRRGSLSLRCSGPSKGLWFDHERGEGGDLLDLIMRERNVPFPGAIAIATEMLGGNIAAANFKEAIDPRDRKDDAVERVNAALRLWHQSGPLLGSAGELYFAKHRGLAISSLPLEHSLKFHSPTSAVVALMTDPLSSKPTGVHRTFLADDGSKRDRKMLGRQGVVRLSADDAVGSGLGLTEGIEDGLAIVLSGWSPVWVATSAGAIARFPVLSNIESLTIFADADDAGANAADLCCDRWRAAGHEVRIASPEVP